MNDIDFERLKELLGRAKNDPETGLTLDEWIELGGFVKSELPKAVSTDANDLILLGLIIVGCHVIERILDNKLSGDKR